MSNVKEPCLVGTCRKSKAAGCKGMCMKCYSSAKKLVTIGKTTWDELVEMGMAEIEATDEFTLEFQRRKQDAEG